MAILNTPLKKIQATCAFLLAANFASHFLPHISEKIDELTLSNDFTQTTDTKIAKKTTVETSPKAIEETSVKQEVQPLATLEVVKLPTLDDNALDNINQANLEQITTTLPTPEAEESKKVATRAQYEQQSHCLSTDVGVYYDDQNHDAIIHFGINPMESNDKIYSYKIDYGPEEYRLYANFKGDLQTQMDTTHYRPRSTTDAVPKDVQIATFLIERAEGVPQRLKYEIIELESEFDKCAKNPESTAISYTQMVRDTAYEKQAVQLANASYPDNMFPYASNMEKGTYPNTGKVRWHINSTTTGREDNRLTRGYHADFTGDTFKEMVVASQKAREDYNRIRQHTTPSYPLNYTSWLAGSGAGENFARLSIKRPNAPIWEIYGKSNLSDTLKEYGDAIAKNPAFFYKNQEKKIFRTIKGAINYLTNTRRISANTFSLGNKEVGFSQRISHWESVAYPTNEPSRPGDNTMQIALMKQAL